MQDFSLAVREEAVPLDAQFHDQGIGKILGTQLTGEEKEATCSKNFFHGFK